MKFRKVLLGIVYWLLQLTWGGLMTSVGLIVTSFVIVFLKGKVHRNGFSYIVEVGGNWGGLELGAVALCGNYSKDSPNYFAHTRCHEFGHTLQNIIFGPLYLFVVGLPSATRYWYQRIRSSKGLPNEEYDQIWFEYGASKWGTNTINKIEGTNYQYTFERKKKVK